MPSHPFTINVASLLRSGTLREETIEAVIDDLFVTGSAVPVGAPVRAELTLDPSGSGHAIHVRGNVTFPFEGDCARCLNPAVGTLVTEIQELFEEDWTEDETWPIVQDRIDIEPLVREAVLLELPLAPVCREDCAGLCPQCGEDRNVVACSCQPATDPRWAALDELHHDQ